MVRALQELAAAAKLGPAEQLQYDPAAVRAEFWGGHCGMAISWPSAAGDRGQGHPAKANGAGQSQPDGEKRPEIQVGFIELPGAPQVFDVGNHTWGNRSEDNDPHVPLLFVAGRMGVVASTSAQPDAALQLLLWLSGDEISPQVCPASAATTLFRQSHLKFPQDWVESSVPAAAAAQFGTVTQKTFLHSQWLGALPIPGRVEYLAALDEAVGRAVRGEQPALEALLDASNQWRKITEQCGKEKQRSAYLHSLGLE
jgi:multiple sugar transport system substrate-binding protein